MDAEISKIGCELLTIFYLYKVLCSFFIGCQRFALLWIAYNFLSLQGSLQFEKSKRNGNAGCELLTIFYLYKVLCSFQALHLLVVQLWIAYNFLSLQGSLQWGRGGGCWWLGCELLTIFYLYKVLCSNSNI